MNAIGRATKLLSERCIDEACSGSDITHGLSYEACIKAVCSFAKLYTWLERQLAGADQKGMYSTLPQDATIDPSRLLTKH